MDAISVLFQTASRRKAQVLCHGIRGTGAGGDHPPFFVLPLRKTIHRVYRPQAAGAVDNIYQTESETLQAVVQAAALACYHPISAG